MKLKVWASYIFFIFTIIVVATVLSEKTVVLTAENAGIRAFYKEQQQIDAVFIGPSSAYTVFLPPIAYNKYGITSAMYSISGMVTEQYIYAAKEVMKYQTPKVLFIVADGIKPLQNRPPSKDNVVALRPISIVKPSINKIKMIRALKKEMSFNNIEILEYYFPIIRFHSRWKNIQRNSYLSNSNPHKGAVIDFEEFYKRKYTYKDKQWEASQIGGYKKQRNPNLYIKDLIDFVRAERKKTKEELEILKYVNDIEDLFFYASTLKNTKVIIIATPSLKYEEYFDRIQYIFHTAKKYGLDSFYMRDCEGLNIDSNNDFLDEYHLNFFGAYKATDYLSNLLVTEYGLKDKRNDSKYNSWDEEYIYYRYEIKRRYNIDVETGELINSETNN